MTKQKIKSAVKTIWNFILNPRFLLCFFLAWMITNGWSYAMLFLGSYYEVSWMIAVSGAYLAFLWLPISPEKIVTVLLAMGFLRLFFPNDRKTLGVLKGLFEKYKAKRKTKKQKNIKINKTQTI